MEAGTEFDDLAAISADVAAKLEAVATAIRGSLHIRRALEEFTAALDRMGQALDQIPKPAVTTGIDALTLGVMVRIMRAQYEEMQRRATELRKLME